MLVKLISDSVLTGFKAGAGLTIAITQLPGLLGVTGGGHNVPDRLLRPRRSASRDEPDDTRARPDGAGAAVVRRTLAAGPPGRARRGDTVDHRCGAVRLTRFGVSVTGLIPSGLPTPALPTLRFRDQEGIVALATGCMLLAYIEGVAAARPSRRNTARPSIRGENCWVSPRPTWQPLRSVAIPSAGGLSQTAVNEKAGARSRLSLVFASADPRAVPAVLHWLARRSAQAVLAAVVLMAVRGLIDFHALVHICGGRAGWIS